MTIAALLAFWATVAPYWQAFSIARNVVKFVVWDARVHPGLHPPAVCRFEPPGGPFIWGFGRGIKCTIPAPELIRLHHARSTRVQRRT